MSDFFNISKSEKGVFMTTKSLKNGFIFLVLGAFLLIGFTATAEAGSPKIEGAEYVGMETCASCHEEAAQRFKLTSHYKGVVEDEEVLGGGCESCHGPGSVHADSMLKKDIVRYSEESCFKCHMGKKMEFQLQHHHAACLPRARLAEHSIVRRTRNTLVCLLKLMRATNSCGATVRREADRQIVQSSPMNLAKVDQMGGVIDSLFTLSG